MRLLLLLWLSAWSVAPAVAEEAPSRFRQAQREAWRGNRERARELCREILAESPRHHDARILLARTLAWDHSYEPARRELRKVLDDRPGYTDASLALADIDLWDDRPGDALATVEAGLARQPGDEELLYRKVRALEKMQRYDEAMAIAREEVRRSGDDRFVVVTDRLRQRNVKWVVSTGYRNEDFREFEDPWQEWYVAVKRPFAWGSLVGRVRHARRFGNDGEQFELDAYPKLPHRMYLYVNAGLAATDPYPEQRVGAELYKNFAGGWEGSLGLRYLAFDSSSVTIYTGSVGKYLGNYWLSLRPTATDRTGGTPTSAALSVRRYLGSRDTWFGGSVAAGSKRGSVVASDDSNLDSSRIRVEGQLRFARLWLLKGGVGYRRKDVSATQDRNSFVSDMSVARRF